MPNIFKPNKSFITTENRKKIKEEYFYWNNSTNLAKKYWYTVHAVNKFLNWSATKTFIDDKWIRWRKCTTCTPLTYKKESEYLTHSKKNWKIFLMSYCKSCHYRKVKNKKIIAKNIWDEKYLNYNRESWDRNKWRYNFRRRYLRIIWYLDRQGRIIKKDQN